jgi:hypothetical protein
VVNLMFTTPTPSPASPYDNVVNLVNRFCGPAGVAGEAIPRTGTGATPATLRKRFTTFTTPPEAEASKQLNVVNMMFTTRFTNKPGGSPWGPPRPLATTTAGPNGLPW